MAQRLHVEEVPRWNHFEAVMWKITTRGFTLGEVLIMAAMNLLAKTDRAGKREKQADLITPRFKGRGAGVQPDTRTTQL